MWRERTLKGCVGRGGFGLLRSNLSLDYVVKQEPALAMQFSGVRHPRHLLALCVRNHQRIGA